MSLFFVLLFFCCAVSFWCVLFLVLKASHVELLVQPVRVVVAVLLLYVVVGHPFCLGSAALPTCHRHLSFPFSLPPCLLFFTSLLSPVSRFLFKCIRKRILIFPFTQKTTTKTATKDTQAVFFGFFFFGHEIWQRCTFLCALFLLLLLFLPRFSHSF